MHSKRIRWLMITMLLVSTGMADINLPYFNSIVVHRGTELVAKQKAPGALRKNHHRLQVINKTLHVRGKGSEVVQVPYLIRSITLEDDANAYFDQIRTKDLALINKGSGRLVLHTKDASVKSIANNDKGIVDVYAIDTPNLDIIGFGGTLHLAGKVTHLRVKLTGDSLFNGKNLLTEHAWVRTQENAAALVHPISTLNAYAINNSQIAYNHRPSDRNVLMETHNLGNVFYTQHPVVTQSKIRSR